MKYSRRNVKSDADLDEICRDSLARYRIDAQWEPVARTIIENTLNAPLEDPVDGSVFRLAEVKRPIAEMEFHLPLNGLDRAGLGRCFRRPQLRPWNPREPEPDRWLPARVHRRRGATR